MHVGTLRVTGKDDADALINRDPLALLLGMLLDQQVPMEWAFAAPHTLSQRLGALDVAAIVAAGPEALEAAFCERPALHRFPSSMAKRAYAMCEFLLENYPSGPIDLWREIQSERETSYLLGSETMKQRLLAAKQRQDGLSIEAVVEKLGI